MRYLLYGEGISLNSVATYLKDKNIEYSFYNDLDQIPNISSVDVVIRSPGINPNSSFLKLCKKNNIKVLSYLDLFYSLNQSLSLIIVTGTNGKTTTCHLLNSILNQEYRFLLGGNMGIGLFQKDISKYDGMIIEASSFMLVDSNLIKPHIYVITNLYSHHLEFHDSKEEYFEAKLHITSKLQEDDYLIYEYENEDIKKYIKNQNHKTKTFSLTNCDADGYIFDNYIYIDGQKLFSLELIKIKNETILKDLLIALLCAKILNLKNCNILKGIADFKELPHRYEIFYKDSNNIFVNDSKSTSVHATLSALSNTFYLYNNYNIILILGGKNTFESYDRLIYYQNKIKKIYLFGENRFIIYRELSKYFDVLLFDDLDELNKNLINALENRDLVLFSPGSSSKDMFASFNERGDYFKMSIIKYLKKSSKN